MIEGSHRGAASEKARPYMSDLKALAGRIYQEVFNEGNLDLIDELLHDDFVEHEQLPGLPTGRTHRRSS